MDFAAVHSLLQMLKQSSGLSDLPSTLYSCLPTPPLGQDMAQGQFLSEV